MFPLRPPFMNFPLFNYYGYKKPSYYQSSLYRGSSFIKKNPQIEPYSPNSSNYAKDSSSYYFPSGATKNTKTNNFSNENSKLDFEQKKLHSEPNEEYFFDVFGLKLYFDDILLICLLFFLYEEGVKDQELFISLILLLLS